jgi:hypothetical protein
LNILFILSVFSPLLPILVFWLFHFNREQRPKWVFFLLLSVGLLIDLISYDIARKSFSTIWLVNLYTIIEFSLLAYFFILIIKGKKIIKIIQWLYILFVAFWLVYNFIIKGISVYDYIFQAIEFILLLAFCIIYLFQKVKIFQTEFVYNTYDFWLVAALLLYCAGTFFSFLVITSDKVTPVTIAFEYISRFGNIFKCILITVAFCINSKNSLDIEEKNKKSIYHITA